MEQLLSVLYGVSGFMAALLYIPQILKYHRERDARSAISLFSWSGWLIVTLVTVLYASYVIKSGLFAAISLTNASAQVIVLFYGIKSRIGEKKNQTESTSEENSTSLNGQNFPLETKKSLESSSKYSHA